MTTTIVSFTDTAVGWHRAFYAFLAEKEQRSGSILQGATRKSNPSPRAVSSCCPVT